MGSEMMCGWYESFNGALNLFPHELFFHDDVITGHLETLPSTYMFATLEKLDGSEKLDSWKPIKGSAHVQNRFPEIAPSLLDAKRVFDPCLFSLLTSHPQGTSIDR